MAAHADSQGTQDAVDSLGDSQPVFADSDYVVDSQETIIVPPSFILNPMAAHVFTNTMIEQCTQDEQLLLMRYVRRLLSDGPVYGADLFAGANTWGFAMTVSSHDL